MINLRTDLALDAKEIYGKESNETKIEGVVTEKETKNNVVITTVKITNSVGAEKLGKPIGTYITLESKKLKSLDPDDTEEISYILKDKLRSIMKIKSKNDCVLIVGLGNWNITPDALGPKVVSEIMVTKHLIDYIPENADDKLRPVCVISPGVMGITGIETGTIVSGVVKKIKPAFVIAVDALASRSPKRISTTIQITDTGINPGSGVGNKREGINEDTLGIPVIAVGVPTVVDAVSIASDMINSLYDNIIDNARHDSQVYNVISSLKKNDQTSLIREVVDDENKELMVTPKEVDNIITHISKVISNGINLALHEDIDIEYIENFVF